MIIQAKYDGSSDQSGKCRGGRSGWILSVLKIELIGFEGWTYKVKNGSKVFVLSHCKRELPYPEKRMVVRQELRSGYQIGNAY